MESKNCSRLLNWLLSWVTDNGEIYGFHNHSVWGTNPVRDLDMTCGHSTFASPFMPALARLLNRKEDGRAVGILRKLVEFQTASFQENGQYEHIGFQMGEVAKVGLIHNVVPDVSLLLTALYGNRFLTETHLESIRCAVERNLEACLEYTDNGLACQTSCCNQEYTRIWAMLLMKKVFGTEKYDVYIEKSLAFMMENFHVSGYPDDTCDTVYRNLSNDEVKAYEPAEYYGLMIAPYVLAYEIFGKEIYLEKARRLAYHVVKSAWTDENGKTRFHRYWILFNGEKIKFDSPMLVAGMGMTVDAVHQLNKAAYDPLLGEFLDKIDETYDYYQTERGFFVSATGWGAEMDIAPSSAWHTHDLLYMADRLTIADTFWEEAFEEADSCAHILLGDGCYWLEIGKRWTIGGYNTMDIYSAFGRKDRDTISMELPAWTGISRTPEDTIIRELPKMIKHGNKIYLTKDYDNAKFYCYPPLELMRQGENR